VPGTPGRLAVVSTPIGNLGDLSSRARDELGAADLIAAEDTRRTGQLLATLGISKPLLSLHEHNESERIEELLTRLEAGARIALVSDAGTPLLSDPGFELVRRVSAAGILVVAVPGPSAITAALSIAGLPTERFSFEGFLPARLGERRARLAELAHESRTLVFFEAPHRIVEALADCRDAFGATRRAAVARELTKAFETVYRGTLEELADAAQRDTNFARGEITLVIEGAPAHSDQAAADANLEKTLRVLLAELSPSKAAAVAAELTGAKRNAAYQLALQLAEKR
jgi:16S rRNA (cytidine1402-2'-O)-methyltransferase